jgi:MinD-like ATPase involved in chromosome partitioning or flagellar assembly
MSTAPAAAVSSPAPLRVAIAAGKGGVGTSTVTALLGATLAATGRRVLIVDAADRLGTLDAMLGAKPSASLEMLRGGSVEPSALIVPVADRLALLPSAAVRGEGTVQPAERRVLFNRIVPAFDQYDVVLFDAGASADSILAAVAHGVTRVLAVTAGDRITVTATFALVKLLHEHHPAVRVDLLGSRIPESVATLAHDCINAATARFLSKTIHLAAVVPDDPHFSTALAAGLGSQVAVQGSSAAVVMHQLGDLLFEITQPPARPAPTHTLRRN